MVEDEQVIVKEIEQRIAQCDMLFEIIQTLHADFESMDPSSTDELETRIKLAKTIGELTGRYSRLQQDTDMEDLRKAYNDAGYNLDLHES